MTSPFALLTLLHLAGTAPADTIVLQPTGTVTLDAALARVRSGGTIQLRAGVYRLTRTVELTRAVTIEGIGLPVLVGSGSHTLLHITADDVILRGVVFRDVRKSMLEDRSAVRIDSTTRCLIEGNRFERTTSAIYLREVTGCRIRRNVVIGGEGDGPKPSAGNAVHLFGTTDIVVEQNQLSRHRDGVFLEFSKGARVEDNRSTGNARYGLHFMFSHDCAYRRNEFDQNGAGIAVMYSKRVTMEGNRFHNHWGAAAYGLLLKDIMDSRIVDNRFENNSVALFMEGANRNTFAGNAFRSNGWALKLMADAEGNHFEDNTFAGNSFDVTSNGRQPQTTFTRNRWDTYRGFDLDRDGFGDVPHRPVRLFAVVVQRTPPALLLLRSIFVQLLDLTERVLPVLTPQSLVDAQPRLGT